MIEQSKKLRNILYKTLVQDPNMEQIRKIMKRVVGRMIHGDDENWLGTLVGGQLDGIDFGLSEATEDLDVGGRHLGN